LIGYRLWVCKAIGYGLWVNLIQRPEPHRGKLLWWCPRRRAGYKLQIWKERLETSFVSSMIRTACVSRLGAIAPVCPSLLQVQGLKPGALHALWVHQMQVVQPHVEPVRRSTWAPTRWLRTFEQKRPWRNRLISTPGVIAAEEPRARQKRRSGSRPSLASGSSLPDVRLVTWTALAVIN
jgi:hypothetical protein